MNDCPTPCRQQFNTHRQAYIAAAQVKGDDTMHVYRCVCRKYHFARGVRLEQKRWK